MLGLLMKKEYILDVLNKRTSFDARLYDSDVRGKIGLIESGTNKLYGYVNMVDVHQITYKWPIKSAWETSSMTAQQPAGSKVLMLERWVWT